MATPTVSVVMSVFNGARFLREAVESILNQSFRSFEFIIIDDGSTDDSAAILDSYATNDSRIRVHHQENRGLVDSLNSGCALARGKYIARMDADDVAVQDRLLWQIEFMERQPDIGVLGGAVQIINAAGDTLGDYCGNPTEDREIKSALFHDHPSFWHPTVLMRNEAILSVHGYRKVVIDAEDHDLWLRIADRFQLSNLSEVVLKYRLHPHQVSTRKCRQQAISSLAARAAAVSRRAGNPDPLDLVTEITPTVLAELGVTRTAQESALARQYRWCVRNLSAAGEYSTALNLLREMLRSSSWEGAENGVIADLRLIAAWLYWRERKFGTSMLHTLYAILACPRVIGRPIKRLHRRLR